MTTRIPCIIPVGPYAGRIGYWLSEMSVYWNVAVWLPGDAVALYYFRRGGLTKPTERQLVERLKSIRCPINADPTPVARALLRAEEAYILSLQRTQPLIPIGTRVLLRFRVGPPREATIIEHRPGYVSPYVVEVLSTLRSGHSFDCLAAPNDFTIITTETPSP